MVMNTQRDKWSLKMWRIFEGTIDKKQNKTENPHSNASRKGKNKILLLKLYKSQLAMHCQNKIICIPFAITQIHLIYCPGNKHQTCFHVCDNERPHNSQLRHQLIQVPKPQKLTSQEQTQVTLRINPSTFWKRQHMAWHNHTTKYKKSFPLQIF